MIVELRAREHRTLQVISEHQINNEQMALQINAKVAAKTEATNQIKHIMQVIEEACQMVPELAISKEELIEVHIHKLAIGVHDTHTEVARVQLELNLKIMELQLKAQPSTP